MIYFVKEGDRIRNGINLYRLSDPGSIGGWLRINRWGFTVRWSKKAKKLFVYTVTAPKVTPIW